MVAAIALNECALSAVIPTTLEETKGLLIVESDTLEHIKFITDNWAREIEATACEVLLCGDITAPCFFKI